MLEIYLDESRYNELSIGYSIMFMETGRKIPRGLFLRFTNSEDLREVRDKLKHGVEEIDKLLEKETHDQRDKNNI